MSEFESQLKTVSYEELLAQDGYLYWKTVGVSMRPLIREGKDTVLIRARGRERCRKFDVVLFRRPGVQGRGRYVLHRILRVNEDDSYWIVGDNCVSGELVAEEDVLGVLDTVVRQGKKLSMSAPLYRLYVRLWCAPYRLRFFILRSKGYPRHLAGALLRRLGLRK